MKKQNKLLNIISYLIITLAIISYSCNKKYEGEDNSNIELIKYKNNNRTYSKTKLDSLQAINLITKQKIQDVLDLSALYTSGNKDTEIDSLIYTQMQAHFLKQDSSNLKNVLKEMDSLKVRYIKINKLEIAETVQENDTIDLANFDMDYFDKKRNYITTVNRTAQYVLKASPVKFKKEFKFYFTGFFNKSKDSIQKIKPLK